MTSTIPIVPIIVGVTGHRNIVPEDIDKLKEAVGIELDRIKLLCQGRSSVTPIVLISGLAEGADRLAAEVAIDRGINLLAVLPMPQAEYEKDFPEPASLTEFRALLQKAAEVIELPLLDKHLKPFATLADVDRTLQYEQLGLFIASNCHLLIALWDGVDLPKRGGTSNIVAMRRGRPVVANPTLLFFRPALPVGYGIQIVTPRQSQSTLNGAAYSTIPIVPESWKLSKVADERLVSEHAMKMFDKIVSNTLELNTDISDQSHYHAKSSALRSQDPPEQDNNLPSDETAHQYHQFGRVLGSLANQFKKRRVTAIKALFALIVLAFVWFELHVKVFSQIAGFPEYVPFLGYLILVGLIVFVYVRARGGRFDEKHEDYRVLAEALRVQTMWRIGGLTSAAADNSIPRQVGELSWIRLALFGLTYPHIYGPAATKPDITYVQKQWIEGQFDFYDDRRRKQSLAVKKVELLGGTLLIGCACIASILCIPVLSPHLAIAGWQLWVSKGLVMMVAVMLAIAAARHGFVEKMALAEQAHQYDRMRNVFDLANKSLIEMGSKGSLSEKQEVLLKLGIEALTEHSEWLIMHRARPLEVPQL